MADKQKRRPRRDDAAQVFRQFAWHLAGTLAGSRPAPNASAKRRLPPAAATEKR
jgi:hypothetical protein